MFRRLLLTAAAPPAVRLPHVHRALRGFFHVRYLFRMDQTGPRTKDWVFSPDAEFLGFAFVPQSDFASGF